MNFNFHLETLPSQTAKIIKSFQHIQPSFLRKFYLSGGTGLSLQIGHRESEDLDFFSPLTFNPIKLQEQVAQFGRLANTEVAKGTLNTYLNDVKLQFLEYPYTLLKPFNYFHGIELSSILDIACTKLQTIGMRGSKKDFIDLYFILDIFSLTELLEAVKKKYAHIEYSQTHILKSLVYFADAENQPMPRIHQQVNWDDVKKRMIASIKNISF